jgi:Coenzyme PQQ synthesis protein D (PqqD)
MSTFAVTLALEIWPVYIPKIGKIMMRSARVFRINRPKVIDEAFDDEVVVINFDTGSYYSLSKAAADIWGMIGAGATAGEAVDALAQRYTGSRPDIEAGVESLIAELERENLIVADTAGRAYTKPATAAEKRAFEAPRLDKYTDMQELILLDPIHEVDETGWPNSKPTPRKNDD